MDVLGRARIFHIGNSWKLTRLVFVPSKSGDTMVYFMGDWEIQARIISARSVPTSETLPVTPEGKIGPVRLEAGRRYVWDIEIQHSSSYLSIDVHVGEDKYLSYLWPVLRSSSDDLVSPSFFQSTTEIKRKGKEYEFEIRMEVTDEQLKKLISEKKAEYQVFIERGDYSPSFKSWEGRFTFSLPVDDIFGPIKVTALIAKAYDEVLFYRNAAFHPDYESRSFRIIGDNCLAIDEKAYSVPFRSFRPLNDEEDVSKVAVSELWLDGEAARKEFYDGVLPTFLAQQDYSSRHHFSPHRFRVVVDRPRKTTSLNLEIVKGTRTNGPRRRHEVVLAVWDGAGKILTYMPKWRSMRSTERIAHFLMINGMIADSGKPRSSKGLLPVLLKATVEHFNPARTWPQPESELYILALSDRVVLGVRGWDREFKYPFVLDVAHMRIVAPDIVKLFLDGTDGAELLYYEILVRTEPVLSGVLPQELVEKCAGKMYKIKLERSLGSRIGV